MKNRQEKFLWIIYAGVLVILFLLSSTDLIIKEAKSEIYSLAIIIEDAKDDNYVNFRKGMDHAAIELNADVSFITLYDAGDSVQQLELAVREAQDGAQALIVSPVDMQALTAAIEENRISVPLVLLNEDLAGDKIATAVSPDYYAMGQLAAEAVIREQGSVQTVYLFAQKEPAGVSLRFYEGILSMFDSTGQGSELFVSTPGYDFRRKIEAMVYPGCAPLVIVALDPESLLATADVLAERDIYTSYVGGLYGRGSNLPILNYLDKGLIRGVCVSDDFSTGYLSVKAAVDTIERKAYQEPVVPESFYITKEDLTKPEYEKVLYPIE